MLRVLHEGLHGCPIMVACAGLPHSVRVLADPEDDPHTISRCALRLSLGLLSPDEAQEAIERGLENLGIACPNGVGEKLAAASMGFPQHVHGYVAGAVAAGNAGADTPGDVFLEAALARGDELRSQYDEARLSSMRAPKGIAYFLAGALQDSRSEQGEAKAMYLHELVSALKQLPAAYNPEGLPPMQVVNAAVEAGVLAEQGARYSFGIPSFHEHVLAGYRRDLGIFGPALHQRLFQEFGRRGWSKPPFEEPRSNTQDERPRRFERLCLRALAEGVVSEAKAAELLNVSVADLNRRMEEPPEEEKRT